MKKCNFKECDKPIAPVDGEFCVEHSTKLATPASSRAARQAFDTQRDTPRSVLAGKNGIHTSVDFAAFMGGLMADVVEGNVSPDQAVAAVNAGKALLAVVEMRLRHGFKNEALELSESNNGVVSPPSLKLTGDK